MSIRLSNIFAWIECAFFEIFILINGSNPWSNDMLMIPFRDKVLGSCFNIPYDPEWCAGTEVRRTTPSPRWRSWTTRTCPRHNIWANQKALFRVMWPMIVMSSEQLTNNGAECFVCTFCLLNLIFETLLLYTNQKELNPQLYWKLLMYYYNEIYLLGN